MNWLAKLLVFNLVTTLYAVNIYDPGTCTEKKRGKFLLARDRNDDDQILACVRRHGKYQWVSVRMNDIKVPPHKSCKEIWKSGSNKGNGVYQISIGNNQHTNVYCQMTSISGCHGGGWTLVMKIDGSSSTFRYDSSYWTSKSTYFDYSYGRDGGLDHREFKGSTYWTTSFKEICVGMKYNGYLRAFSFSHPASSLYDLISDGRYRPTNLGRNKWKSLITGSSLQRNCNREGFNVYHSDHARVRLGIFSNQENDCNTPDSFIGFGGGYLLKNVRIPAGNGAICCFPDNGEKNLRGMGYILVR